MPYQPGLHIIATLQSDVPDKLRTSGNFNSFLDNQIKTFSLQKLGEVYHDFEPHGFTGIVCLSESHISVHTWPEHNLVNLDIYLSNFERNNDGTVEAIYMSLVRFFEATVTQVQKITR